jgi:hypothetical protein
VVEILENLLRRAERLLENVVDAYQPLHRLQEHQTSAITKLVKSSGGQRARLDLRPAYQQQDNRDGREHLDQRGRKRLLQHVAHVGLQQLTRGVAEPPGFVGFGAEGLHHHVAAERLLQNLAQLGLPLSCVRRLVRRMRRPMRVVGRITTTAEPAAG